MEIPQPNGRFVRVAKLIAAIGCVAIALVALWQAAEWQNSIRTLMELEPVDAMYSLKVTPVALTVFAILIGLARLFRLILRFMTKRLNRILPRPVSRIIGVIAAALLFWSILNGILFGSALGLADASYRELDKLIEPETERPMDPLKTGSNASLLGWRKLGRAGREFISSGPSREEISTFLGRHALEPIRVYVGLRSAETPQARAKLALEELKRVGGFERSVLIVIAPIGTGWVDPAAMDSVEYLHGRDVASVALQYSYLGSWLYVLMGADYRADAARALFVAIYGYWTTLPKDKRPRLYLPRSQSGRRPLRTFNQPA
jgi:uncharacterized membrane protein